MELKSGAKLKGKWEIRVYDNAKDMNLISKSECHNVLTNEGLDAALDNICGGAAQITPLYCLMFNTDTTPTGGTTYAAPGRVFTETEAYTEATRPEFEANPAASQSVDNVGALAVFTMDDAETMYGAALVGGGTDPDTKGDLVGGGIILCAGKFTTPQPVIATNVVNLTYTVTGADDGL